MTVSYQYEVASSTSGGFTRLLLMWRGSLYKLIYRELVLFVIMFASLSAIYRHALTDLQKRYALNSINSDLQQIKSFVSFAGNLRNS